MNNKGQVTVFISMVLVVLMIFIPAVIHGINVQCANTKAVTLFRTAESGVKADYNRYIFDEYHLLLIDKDYYGKGEGMIEELIDSSLRANLGDAFTVESVELAGVTSLMDDDLLEFRNEISEYFVYGALDSAIDKVSEYIEGDFGMSDSDIDEMKKKTGGYDGKETEGGTSAPSDEDDEETVQKKMSYQEAKEKDPRKSVSLWAKLGIGNLIKPDSLLFSDTVLNQKELPSYGHTGLFSSPNIDTDFNSFNNLRSYLEKEKLTGGKLINNAELLCYADKLFSSAVTKKNSGEVLRLEKEYLIAGHDTDMENYNFVVNELLAMKFVPNLVYLLNDSEKMSEIEAVASAIAILVPPAEPVIEYLITACWAYAESVVDVYRLLRGNKVTLIKTKDTWKTSLDHLSDFALAKNDDSDALGLSYDQYLIVLMALTPNSVAYRMLDVIEENTVHAGYEGFSMKNAITEFRVNACISYGSNEFYFMESAGF